MPTFFEKKYLVSFQESEKISLDQSVRESFRDEIAYELFELSEILSSPPYNDINLFSFKTIDPTLELERLEIEENQKIKIEGDKLDISSAIAKEDLSFLNAILVASLEDTIKYGTAYRNINTNAAHKDQQYLNAQISLIRRLIDVVELESIAIEDRKKTKNPVSREEFNQVNLFLRNLMEGILHPATFEFKLQGDYINDDKKRLEEKFSKMRAIFMQGILTPPEGPTFEPHDDIDDQKQKSEEKFSKMRTIFECTQGYWENFIETGKNACRALVDMFNALISTFKWLCLGLIWGTTKNETDIGGLKSDQITKPDECISSNQDNHRGPDSTKTQYRNP